jgi:hypothetical protein
VLPPAPEKPPDVPKTPPLDPNPPPVAVAPPPKGAGEPNEGAPKPEPCAPNAGRGDATLACDAFTPNWAGSTLYFLARFKNKRSSFPAYFASVLSTSANLAGLCDV